MSGQFMDSHVIKAYGVGRTVVVFMAPFSAPWLYWLWSSAPLFDGRNEAGYYRDRRATEILYREKCAALAAPETERIKDHLEKNGFDPERDKGMLDDLVHLSFADPECRDELACDNDFSIFRRDRRHAEIARLRALPKQQQEDFVEEVVRDAMATWAAMKESEG